MNGLPHGMRDEILPGIVEDAKGYVSDYLPGRDEDSSASFFDKAGSNMPPEQVRQLKEKYKQEIIQQAETGELRLFVGSYIEGKGLPSSEIERMSAYREIAARIGFSLGNFVASDERGYFVAPLEKKVEPDEKDKIGENFKAGAETDSPIYAMMQLEGEEHKTRIHRRVGGKGTVYRIVSAFDDSAEDPNIIKVECSKNGKKIFLEFAAADFVEAMRPVQVAAMPNDTERQEIKAEYKRWISEKLNNLSNPADKKELGASSVGTTTLKKQEPVDDAQPAEFKKFDPDDQIRPKVHEEDYETAAKARARKNWNNAGEKLVDDPEAEKVDRFEIDFELNGKLAIEPGQAWTFKLSSRAQIIESIYVKGRGKKRQVRIVWKDQLDDGFIGEKQWKPLFKASNEFSERVGKE
jgi:hypothetical protein